MQKERFIAGRLRFRGKMAVAATAISYFVIIVAVAVSSGFRNEVRDGLAQMYGDIVLSGNPLEASDSIMDVITSTPGVRNATAVINRPGIVKNGSNIQGVIFKGVPGMEQSLQADIPSSLAKLLKLKEGDSFNSYFVEERLKVRKFTVSKIYESPVQTESGLVVLVPIEDMRRLNLWKGDEASSIEVTLSDSDMSRDRLHLLTASLGFVTNLDASSVREEYSQLFDWLDLLDFNVIAILILMTVVAAFNMISGLYIMLFRSTSTIGILKSVGMTDKSLSSVFLLVAARIVAVGMVAGNALALLFCLVQNSTHLIRLDPENYFLSYVPVHVDPGFVFAADAVSFTAIMLLLLIPTLFIAKVDPALTSKHE